MTGSVSAVLTIVLIDLVLSGDNSVAIGMAARRLPPRQRRLAIVGGASTAIALRVGLTAAAGLLLRVALLRLLAGLLLVWVGGSLLREERPAGPPGARTAAPASFREAIATIVVADAVMSLDNVLGVAGAARGNLELLAFGVTLSMTLMMLAGSLIASLLDACSWLAYLGSTVIAWTGGDVALHDPVVRVAVALPGWAQVGLPAAVALATVLVAHRRYRRGAPRPWGPAGRGGSAAAGGSAAVTVGQSPPRNRSLPTGRPPASRR
jgi:YjbE family integral membrane protein